MLGLVFTEFMEMVEDNFSPEVLDDIIEDSQLSSDGAYTSVGYYDYQDMIKMVVALSKRVDLPIDDLVEAFGKHLFGVLISKYPSLLGDHNNCLDFLETVDSTVHIQVLKLYPQAELPKFNCQRLSPTHLEMHYSSKRPFSILALGLLKGCGEYYNNALSITYSSREDGDYHLTDFDIKLIDE